MGTFTSCLVDYGVKSEDDGGSYFVTLERQDRGLAHTLATIVGSAIFILGFFMD